ncbi:hypothetical protein [Clostridium massiliamazoniense]|uniref:hypothetical protein n=1 Tax=Clostridium massiliamazoniense TaxID=1347366 RepID=UPI0006D7FB5C|nr:hypothetical protein [Clostridium massiliamazoniense]
MKKFILLIPALLLTLSLSSCSKNNNSLNKNTSEKSTLSQSYSSNNQDANNTENSEIKEIKDTYIFQNINSSKSIDEAEKRKLIEETITKTIANIDEPILACFDNSSLKSIKSKQIALEITYNDEKNFSYINKENIEEKIPYKTVHLLSNSKKLGTNIYNIVILQNGHSYRAFTSTYDYSNLFNGL